MTTLFFFTFWGGLLWILNILLAGFAVYIFYHVLRREFFIVFLVGAILSVLYPSILIIEDIIRYYPNNTTVVVSFLRLDLLIFMMRATALLVWGGIIVFIFSLVDAITTIIGRRA